MKYLIVLVLGLLLGAAAAGAVLYYNPLTAAPTRHADDGNRHLQYEVPGQSLVFAHGARALLPGTVNGDAELWEETINRTALLALSLNDAQGVPIAAASRLMQASSDTDLLLRGVLLSDYWLLTIPGEGSLFLRVDSNLWPFLKQTFIPSWYFGQPWQGSAEFQPTVGPGPRSAAVIGATGRFTGITGSAVEQYRLTALEPARRELAFAAELHLDLQEPEIVAGE